LVGKTKRSRGGRGRRRGRCSVSRKTLRAARRGRRELSKLAAAPQPLSPPQTETVRKDQGAHRLGYLRRRRANWMSSRFAFCEQGLGFDFPESFGWAVRDPPWGRKVKCELPSDVHGVTLGSGWDIERRCLFWLRLARLGRSLTTKSYPVPPPFTGRRGRPDMYKWFIRFWEVKNGTWEGVSPLLKDGPGTYPSEVLAPQMQEDASRLSLPDVGPGYEGSSRSRIAADRLKNRSFRKRRF